MPNFSKSLAHLFASTLLAAFVLSSFSYAVTADRISSIDTAKTFTLQRSLRRNAIPKYDRGPVEPSFEVHGMMLFTKPSAAQQKELDEFAAQQQNRKSANYHKWLTPAQYGERFGLSTNDLNKITSWLKSEGFTIDHIGAGRGVIRFSGNALQVNSAFRTDIHRYNVDGVEHFANSTALMIPAALANIVTGISGVSDFRPHAASAAQFSGPKRRPNYTDTNLEPFPNFLAPGDIYTIYSVPSSADGSSQSVAIIGETDIFLADINDFRTGFGLTTIATSCAGSGSVPVITSCNDPHFQYILVPGETDPGHPDSVQGGDIGESDLDIEWSGAAAPNAKIVFINAPQTGVGTSLEYAIEPPTGTSIPAPVVSMSYTSCEIDADFFDSLLLQGTTEGITIVNSAGDAGAAACDNTPTSSSRPFSGASGGETVNYPASSPYVIAAGGTSISIANDSYPNPSSYWGSTNGTNGGSATSYIPEQAWNDDVEFASYCQDPLSGTDFCTSGGGESGWVSITSAQTAQEDVWIAAGGGGASNCAVGGPNTGCTAGEPQPTWQSGLTVANAPAGVRWVPDVSLLASADFPGYIFCTPQDPDDSPATYTSTCVNGITGSTGAVEGFESIIGGTSASAPIFAGFVALLNQATASTTGQGDIHTTLYGLASSSPAAFNQVTSGNNMVYCQPGTPSVQPANIKCPAAGIYGFNASDADATTGYNLVTGLGSVNVGALITAWPGSTSTGSSFSLSPTASSFPVTQGSSATATVTLTFNNGFTGTVTFTCSDPATESTCTVPSPTTTTSSGCTTQNGSTTCPVSFTISTTGASSSLSPNRPLDRGSRMLYAMLMPGLFGIVLMAGTRKRSIRGMRMLGLMLVLGASTMWLGACGGSNNKSQSNPGTPVGNYTITVTGTSGSTTANTTFTLAVSQ
jgi:subtilase family serine protease